MNKTNSKQSGELILAILLLFYTFTFLIMPFLVWLKPNFLFKFNGSRWETLKTILYVISAGGLGSTTYCIRSFYFYYIKKEFDFNLYKWWYIFRPLTGCILATALFTLLKGGVVVFGALPSENSGITNFAFFGISFLAGYSTEQVIERLRKVSKALFGEENRDNQNDNNNEN